MNKRVVERLFSKIIEIYKVDTPGCRVGLDGYQLILPEGQLYCDPHKVWHGENDSGLTEEEAGALYAMVEEKYSRRMETFRRIDFLLKFLP